MSEIEDAANEKLTGPEPAYVTRTMTTAARKQRQLAPLRTGLYVKAENGRRLRDRKVRRLVAKMKAAMSWLAPSDDPACRAWAECEILASHVFGDLVRNGLTTDQDEPRRLLSEYRGLRSLQLAYEKELGMTPSARAALGIQVKALMDVSKMSLEDYVAWQAHQQEPQP
jgi:hypothetical protein